MFRAMFGYRPKPKQFDLPLRYYDPTEDQREAARQRIKIQANPRIKPKQNLRVLVLALILSMLVYIITIL